MNVYHHQKHWYLDTGALRTIADRHLVEPMLGGYQILAPQGIIRCKLQDIPRLPGQRGQLYHCQGQHPGQDLGAQLKALVGAGDAPALAHGCSTCPTKRSGTACCTACQHGHTCSCSGSALERLIVSETLGTVRPHQQGSVIELYPASDETPEWACGRYHECIGSILDFGDLVDTDALASVRFADTLEIDWHITLDRRRKLLLSEILEHVARLAHEQPPLPDLPSPLTPGAAAWRLVRIAANGHSACPQCPYRLGSNLRCSACRSHIRSGEESFHRDWESAKQREILLEYFRDEAELQAMSVQDTTRYVDALLRSHAFNPFPALSDEFFRRQERDILSTKPTLADEKLAVILAVAEIVTVNKSVALNKGVA